jgi:hypothetical protein
MPQTDSDRVKGDGESVPISIVKSERIGYGNKRRSELIVEEINKWKFLTEIEIYTNTKTFLCVRP